MPPPLLGPQEPRAPPHAGVRARAAVQVSLLQLQQAPPQRAQEAPREEAPARRAARAHALAAQPPPSATHASALHEIFLP